MNSISGSDDKLSLVRADIMARVCREYYSQHQQLGTPFPAFGFGEDDVKKAFRRLFNTAWYLYVIFVWDYVRQEVAYFMLTSFIFGCYAAVMAWNRVPALYCRLHRHVF